MVYNIIRKKTSGYGGSSRVIFVMITIMVMAVSTITQKRLQKKKKKKKEKKKKDGGDSMKVMEVMTMVGRW
jgi:hypothetical protein